MPHSLSDGRAGLVGWAVGLLGAALLRSNLIACFFATSPSAGGPGGMGATFAPAGGSGDGLHKYGRADLTEPGSTALLLLNCSTAQLLDCL